MLSCQPFVSSTRTVVLQRQAYGFRNWRTRLGTHRVAVDTINATFTKAFRLNTTRMLGPGRVVAISYSSAVARFLSESAVPIPNRLASGVINFSRRRAKLERIIGKALEKQRELRYRNLVSAIPAT